jgi:hypothetical protein
MASHALYLPQHLPIWVKVEIVKDLESGLNEVVRVGDFYLPKYCQITFFFGAVLSATNKGLAYFLLKFKQK